MPERASQWLHRESERLAERITAVHLDARPELAERYGPEGRNRCRQDAHYHLKFLCTALRRQSPALFADYIRWTRALLGGLGIGEADLRQNLAVLGSVIDSASTDGHWRVIEPILRAGSDVLDSAAEPLESCIDPAAPLAAEARRYLNHLLAGERQQAIEVVTTCLAQGVRVADLYLHLLAPVQHEVGRLWQLNRLSVADEHYCTAVAQLCASMLFPSITATPRDGRRLAMICATDDLHEFPSRVVADLFELDGWTCHYFGASVPVRGLTQTLRKCAPDLIAISVTMPFHLDNVETMIGLLRGDEMLGACPIMVGGLALQSEPELWRSLGADGYAADAESAIALAHQLRTRSSA